ncbi:MAG: glucuronate isomerase [Anaerolineae bacterium]|nr:glucuronate isomerase [Anaerolineae bacterium]
MTQTWTLDDNRYFDPNPTRRAVARELYSTVAHLPLVCPHGHVDPRLFASSSAQFGTPTELLIIPDHYVFRMLYSQGISLDRLGITRADGTIAEHDHRKIWQLFADHFYLFQGTPTGAWLKQELIEVFDIHEKLNSSSAQRIYNLIVDKLATPAFMPRQLFQQFNIEVMCTTDAASDDLAYHQAIRDSGWSGRIIPTFRPDAVVNLDAPGWRKHLDALCQASSIDINSYGDFILALLQRRAYFKTMGAQATDHGAYTAYTARLSAAEAESIFQRALAGKLEINDARLFSGHMLMMMAEMSLEDGLVMQIHVGSYRNHNTTLFERYGADKGCDIPIRSEFTCNLHPLLNAYGNDPRLTLVLFTLDEDSYARELAPLAGHYPALKIGPPWWFHDSLNGMRRYFDRIMETAGIYNTAGFNDDTRAFPSIPARHDVWRRAAANWIAGLVTTGCAAMEDAADMIHAVAYGLAKEVYKLGD